MKGNLNHPRQSITRWFSKPIMNAAILCTVASVLISTPSMANEPAPINATIEAQGAGYFTISVTVKHEDAGWKHYVDRWEVWDPEDNKIATRVLLHPHVNEQPFTRSLTAMRIAPDIAYVMIQVHDSLHGYGRRKIKLDIPH